MNKFEFHFKALNTKIVQIQTGSEIWTCPVFKQWAGVG